ncbi:hypothetical protein C8Q76DRAFT_388520 [Earliella scabrosa]|nr:hypothetical protein C8Q76DRAFT_388520 [Earliella scabrosa]
MGSRRALEQLQQTSRHVDWTHYLLDNLEDIAKKAFLHSGQLSSSSEPSSSPDQSTTSLPPERRPVARPVVRLEPASVSVSTTVTSRTRSSSPIRPPSRAHAKTVYRSKSSNKAALRPFRDDESAPSAPIENESTSARFLRRGPVEQYHDFTHIPHLPPTIIPKPPRRNSEDLSDPRFTDEDKVFFIHYLQWRLRDGPVPKKEQLYAELAKQTPHHDAEAWKRHWADAPELPDQVFIAARKREKQEAASQAGAEVSDEGPSSGTRTGESSDGGEDCDDHDDAGTFPMSASQVRQARLPPPPRRRAGTKVTEEDLRRMARYMVAKVPPLGQARTFQGYWREFAERPKNKARRTLAGWASAARDHADELSVYFKEYNKGRRDADAAAAAAAAKVCTPPQQDSGSPVALGSRAPRPKAERAEEGTMTTAATRKRPSVEEGAFPDEKRMKRD